MAIGIISEVDSDLASLPWYLSKKGYVTCQKPNSHRNTKLMLHRVILNAPPGVKVDHRNRNTLDNRRENLRLATNKGNCQNRSKMRNNTSGFKGVSWDKDKWRAVIHTDGKWIRLGRFEDPEIAAHAYDEAAQRFYGEFAAGNF